MVDVWHWIFSGKENHHGNWDVQNRRIYVSKFMLLFDSPEKLFCLNDVNFVDLFSKTNFKVSKIWLSNFSKNYT